MSTQTYSMAVAQEVNRPVADLWPDVVDMDLTQVFNRRVLAFPAVRQVAGDGRPWGSALGQLRTIRLADRATMREELVGLEAPHGFDYQLTRLRGPLGVIAARVDGHFRLREVSPATTELTWAWDMHPRAGRGPLMPVFASLWRRYAEVSLANLATG